MGALTPTHLILILIIALIIIGPGRLPEVGAALGKSIKEFKKASGDIVDGVTAAPASVVAPPAQPVSQAQPAPPYQAPVGSIPPQPGVAPYQAAVQYYPAQPAPIATAGDGYQPATGTVVEPPSGPRAG